MNEYFYRVNDAGNADIFHSSGEIAVRFLPEETHKTVYPVGSGLSARYEHPNGIVLTVADAESLGIKEEDAVNPRACGEQ